MRILLKTCSVVIIALIMSIFLANAFAANAAPDSSVPGPWQTASEEYRLPPAIDSDVLNDRITEIWGKIFYPVNKPAGKSPLVIFLHGNHGTCGSGTPRVDQSCDYTFSGTCPPGQVPTPNHAGYDYLAKNLASWGFVVASINANRGITCGGGVAGDWGLNLARGRLVLKHLSHFYTWATTGGAPFSDPQLLVNKIDFASVGLLGHSRGGEGVRAAYNLFEDKDSLWPAKIPGLNIKAIFEIGAVDGQTSRVLDANGIVWNQLLPLCDGDVSSLEGRRPFERMLLNTSEKSHAQKSLYEVWGANHNFFNTEWQESDSRACSRGTPIFDKLGSYSLKQQQIALSSVPAFFRSWLMPATEAAYNQNFNPLHNLPSIVTATTSVDRDFTPSPGSTEIEIVDEFDKETGKNSSGNDNLANQIQITHMFLEKNALRVAHIEWKLASPQTWFEAVWASAGQGRNIHNYATLDFRVRRVNFVNEPTNFDIALEDANGLVSKPVPVSNYAMIKGPGNANPIFYTVRIPLKAFQGVDMSRIHGVRFIFDKTPSGAIYLGNVRMHRQWGFGSDAGHFSAVVHPASMPVQMTSLPVEHVPVHLNRITKIRRLGKTLALSGKPAVEISFASEVAFPALNRLPILQIGDKKFKLSRYTDSSHLKEITFILTPEEYNHAAKDAAVSIADGKVWQFSTLGKNTY